LEKRAEQILPGSEGGGGRERGQGAGGRNGQTMYVHLNKWINKQKEKQGKFSTTKNKNP
jgi:hypothetical protein